MTSNTSTSPGGFEARPSSRPGDAADRSPAEIEAEIERTRQRLAGTVDAIAERVNPANVARRGAESAKAQVVDERGQVRTGRAAGIAAAVVAVVGFLAWRRSR
ncbi:MAG: DUF3618 domain-containing protein [Sporichthyaceae bacterium]